MADGGRALVVAEDAQGICGTVQLILDLPENQPHRADVAKMLVHRRARRHGLGAALMQAAEAAALATTGGRCSCSIRSAAATAARLYERLGWMRVGEVPDYALMPRRRALSDDVLLPRSGHRGPELNAPASGQG